MSTEHPTPTSADVALAEKIRKYFGRECYVKELDPLLNIIAPHVAAQTADLQKELSEARDLLRDVSRSQKAGLEHCAALSVELGNLKKRGDELAQALLKLEPSGKFKGWEDGNGEPIDNDLNAALSAWRAGK